MHFMTKTKYISCPSFDPDGEKWRDVVHFVSYISGKPALLDPITEMKYKKCTSSGNISPNPRNELHKMDFMTEAKYISCFSFGPDGEK